MDDSRDNIPHDSIQKEFLEQLNEAKTNKKWDEVISIINDYKHNEPKNLNLYLELCIAYREIRDYKKALGVLNQAKKNNLQSPWIHDNYSRIYSETKNYTKAIKECLIALKMSDDLNRHKFIELLNIIKNQLDHSHSENQYLSVASIDVDFLLEKIFSEKIDPASINLEIEKRILPEQCKLKFDSLDQEHLSPDVDKDIKLIAYYLPQFHPIIENDEWWGAGFTEWINVTQATSYFKNHYQPHVPGELGYYDLRLPEVREAQAKLAREHGIYGFCYYYYWFAGRKLLERPLQEVFESGRPDFPFCICWANENWSRRWDGSENEVLVQQVHNEQTDEDFIHDVIPLFKDLRYIKVKGAPLLIIYRINLMPDPGRTSEKWRKICADNGIPEIHLCMAETFGLTDPHQYGFNSAVQFPPHNMVSGLFPQDSFAPDRVNNDFEDLAENFSGDIYDFESIVKDQIAKVEPGYKQFPGVMVAWDNTARKKNAGLIFNNSTPGAYEIWLRAAIDRARQSLPKGEQLVFINAWNEWAEGAHLEPDKKNGRGYLEATRRALMGNSDWQLLMDYAIQLPELSGLTKKNVLADLHYVLERLTKVNEYLLSTSEFKNWSKLRPGRPSSWTEFEYTSAGDCHLDTINHYKHFDGQRIVIDSIQKLRIIGWAFHDARQVLREDTPSYLVLEAISSELIFFAPLAHRLQRTEVANAYKNPNIRYSGIDALLDASEVPSGCYYVSIACWWDNDAINTRFNVELEIV